MDLSIHPANSTSVDSSMHTFWVSACNCSAGNMNMIPIAQVVCKSWWIFSIISLRRQLLATALDHFFSTAGRTKIKRCPRHLHPFKVAHLGASKISQSMGEFMDVIFSSLIWFCKGWESVSRCFKHTILLQLRWNGCRAHALCTCRQESRWVSNALAVEHSVKNIDPAKMRQIPVW